MKAITDPITGDRVIWRGGTTIRAYDRRARLISNVDLGGAEPDVKMRQLARALRSRRSRFSHTSS